MKVTCFGSRGSIPSPGHAHFGGDTSCYLVEAGDEIVILDGGSGIRRLGNELMRSGRGVGKTYHIPLSHYHWDHQQGLPFFVPLFIPSNTVHFYGFVPANQEEGPKTVVEQMLQHQQSSPHFPVAHRDLPAKRLYHDLPRQFASNFKIGKLSVTSIPLNHPDGCLGYAIESEDCKIVYASDNEPLRHTNAMINKHGAHADLIILDGQYTEEELASTTQTYGHGSPEACLEQALSARATRLWVHHHDPARTSEQLFEMESKLKLLAPELRIQFAYDGICF